jgi:O-antigen/teichoic acid export membrane protein
MLISSIDKIIVNDMLGLAAAGVFSVATYFGSMIQIPARSILRISTTVIAESWKSNDLQNIADVYRKSCMNQLIIGLLLLAGLWVNIDSLLALMPPDYAQAKYVILFMGLGYLIDLATGANGVIIATSKHYRYDTFFMVLLVIFTLITNVLLIPRYGMMGAGIASCMTYALFNLLRLIFIQVKFKLQPYSLSFVWILLIGVISIVAAQLIPISGKHYLDIALRGSVLCLVYGTLILLSRVSPEITGIVLRLKNKR